MDWETQFVVYNEPLKNNMNTRYYSRIYLAAGLVALIVLSLLGYSYYSSNRMVSVHAPLVQAIEGIRVETATAHLWVEEILNGKNEHNMDEVSWLLDEADWYAQALLEGGKDSKTEYIPVHDPFLRQQIQELREKLATLREITEERYELDDASEDGTEIEQYYDDIFNALNDQAKKVVEQAHQIINQEVKQHRSAQSILVVISLFLFILIGLLFYDHQSSLKEHARHLEIEISERKQAEEKLKAAYSDLDKSEKQFRAILDNSPAFIYLKDIDGRQLMVNNKWLSVLGLTNEEVIGHTDYEIFGREIAEQYVANDRKVLASMSMMEFEEEAALGDGIHTYISYKFPLLDESGQPYALCGISSDITARKRAEEKLQASEEKYRLITNSIPVVISYLDAEQRYQFNNTNFEKLFRINSDEIIGHHIRDVIGDSDYGVVQPYLEAALAGEQVNYEFEYHHEKKEPLIINVIYVPDVAPDGGVLGVYIMSSDITTEKQYERRLQRSQRLEALGQMTGGFAHNFNNILAIILGYLDLYGKKLQDDTKAMHFLDRITFNVHRAASLNQQLQAFSHEQVLMPASIDLNTLILDIENLIQQTIRGNIRIETSFAEDLVCCFVDASQLETSILHLANNARDAMPEGGKLTIETAITRLDEDYAAVHVDVVAGQYAMLAITDTGTGMSEEVQAHAFEPFYTTKEVGKGSGLGLSMVYGFIKQSKGHVTIDSKVGEGTTVKLLFPHFED